MVRVHLGLGRFTFETNGLSLLVLGDIQKLVQDNQTVGRAFNRFLIVSNGGADAWQVKTTQKCPKMAPKA
jgi:hypothetical protein